MRGARCGCASRNNCRRRERGDGKKRKGICSTYRNERKNIETRKRKKSSRNHLIIQPGSPNAQSRNTRNKTRNIFSLFVSTCLASHLTHSHPHTDKNPHLDRRLPKLRNLLPDRVAHHSIRHRLEIDRALIGQVEEDIVRVDGALALLIGPG